MVLSGWKEIANYLHLGTRTVQRWERLGLPIDRPVAGRRSHVFAYSDQLDTWVQHEKGRQSGPPDVVVSIENARRLRAQAEAARTELHIRMKNLKDEIAALRTRRRGTAK